MAFLAKRSPVFGRDEGFEHQHYEVRVFRTQSLDVAVQQGAPDTSLDTFASIAKFEHLFQLADKGPLVQYCRILLINFGRFMHQDEVWAWAKKNRLDGQFAHPRTVLAFASVKRFFCLHVQQSRVGLVTFKPKIPHQGQHHVLTLYYDNMQPRIYRALKLDPYTCGWAAHHWFCFELPVS
jgi:hypothetical protein